MRYRKLDIDGDYTIGTNSDFYIDSPEAVAQAVKTRLLLWQGEWFLDSTDGTPWNQQILGKRNRSKNYDAAIRQRILGTDGVTEISEYSSSYNGDTRALSVTARVATIYGDTQISIDISV